MKKAIIVGAGIGGLCTALRLLGKGYSVTVFEKEPTLGGKVNIKNSKGAKFDLTASILMTPDIYTEIFQSLGKDYRDYIDLINLDPIYKVYYSDGNTYEFYSDLRKMVNVLESMDKGLSVEYLDFIYTSYKKYFLSNEYFLNKPMVSKKDFLAIKSIDKLLEINPLSTVDKYISSKINNEKLREYLIFQAMYIGINPFENSNLYTLIPAISHIYGLWYIKGGLYNYIVALEKLIYELGGTIEVGKEVTEIIVDNNTAKGVVIDSVNYTSDIVVCNADFPYAIKNLFKNPMDEGLYTTKNVDDKSYSCSVFIIYLGLKKKYEGIKVHNIYISKDFKESIEDPFNGKLPKYPSIYLYCPSAEDDDISGEYKQILNVVVRVPNLSFKEINWNEETILKFRDIVLNQVKSIDIFSDLEEHIVYENYLTPKDLMENYNSYNGTAFGLSHKLSETTYFRPHIKSKNIKGLYYIGSSTHPGNGVSVIIHGSKLVESQINADDF
ncbi:MAG: phytoene desaturase family protein [Clostridium sp.]|uniref:phytoene desaturase family protein n=1 Tax=Clostridium sp. TaxID=1506 RepID=UPI00306A11B9